MSNQLVRITFPDGQQQEFPQGVTLTHIAQSISPGLRKKAVAGSVNGTTVDLTRPILEDADIAIYDAGSQEGIGVLRHSAAHILAQAIRRLYPDASFGVGPVIENGFYYDIDIEKALVPEDLVEIEDMMGQIVQEDLLVLRKEVTKDEAEVSKRGSKGVKPDAALGSFQPCLPSL